MEIGAVLHCGGVYFGIDDDVSRIVTVLPMLKPSGSVPSAGSVMDRIEPFQIVTVARMPPLRFEASLRLLKTLRMMKPRSDDSILVSRSTLVYKVARENGMKITAKKEDGRLRIWRIA